jgi:hypothetical protein
MKSPSEDAGHSSFNSAVSYQPYVVYLHIWSHGYRFSPYNHCVAFGGFTIQKHCRYSGTTPRAYASCIDMNILLPADVLKAFFQNRREGGTPQPVRLLAALVGSPKIDSKKKQNSSQNLMSDCRPLKKEDIPDKG